MDIEEQLLELVRRAACELPADIAEALAAAQGRETVEGAKGILGTLCRNCALAAEQSTPMCQDTGTLTFFWRVPAGTAQAPLIAAANAAVRRATAGVVAEEYD